MTGEAAARRKEDSVVNQHFIQIKQDLDGLNPHQEDFSPECNENNDEKANKKDEKEPTNFYVLFDSPVNALLSHDALISEPELEHVGETKKSRLGEVSRSGMSKFMLLT